jgi:hypothetical protein
MNDNRPLQQVLVEPAGKPCELLTDNALLQKQCRFKAAAATEIRSAALLETVMCNAM